MVILIRASRFVISAVLALLFLCAMACSDSEEPRASETADWKTMTAIPSQWLGYMSVDELAQRSGLKLALPSYLPEGTKRYAAWWEQYDSKDPLSFRASITVPSNPSANGLLIKMIEWQRQPSDPLQEQGGSLPGKEFITVGQVTGSCQREPQDVLMTPPPPPPHGLGSDIGARRTSIRRALLQMGFGAVAY